MKKETAKTILDIMQDVSGRLNDSIFLVMEAAEEDEIRDYKRAIGRAMGEVYLGIMSPILDRYPDLTPESLRSDSMPEGFYDPKEGDDQTP